MGFRWGEAMKSKAFRRKPAALIILGGGRRKARRAGDLGPPASGPGRSRVPSKDRTRSVFLFSSFPQRPSAGRTARPAARTIRGIGLPCERPLPNRSGGTPHSSRSPNAQRVESRQTSFLRKCKIKSASCWKAGFCRAKRIRGSGFNYKTVSLPQSKPLDAMIAPQLLDVGTSSIR